MTVRGTTRLVRGSGCIVGLLLLAGSSGCREKQGPPIVDDDGIVRLEVWVTAADSAPVGGAGLSVSVAGEEYPQYVWIQFGAATDSAGRFQHTIHGHPISPRVIVRVRADPPLGVGLSPRTDSLVTGTWFSDPPADTARIHIVLRGLVSLSPQ